MDESKILIITARGDQTKEIADIIIDEHIVHILFYKKEKYYKYNTNKVVIKQNPAPLNINHQAVLYDGMPLRNVKQVLVFEDMTKVFFQSEQTQVFASASITIVPIGKVNMDKIRLIDYWQDIAQYITIDDQPETFLKAPLEPFLKTQFSKLNAVHPNSVLASYLNKTPIVQGKLSTIPNIYPFRFNLSQKHALEQALVSKISIIEGPPGTGKTQTILNILANLAVMQNKSVAVVSGNNAAVQNVKDKLDKNGYGFIAASLGRSDYRKAFFQNLPEYDVSKWKSELKEEEILKTINDVSAKLERLLELANRKAKLEQQISAYRLEQKHFKLHHNNEEYEGMERLFYRRQTPAAIIAFLADEYFRGERSLRFLDKTKLLFKYGFINFKKLNKNRLELITKCQMKYYESKLTELEQEINRIQAQLDQASFEELLGRHEASSASLFKYKLYQKYKGKKVYHGNEMNYKRKFNEFTEHFPILLSTTHSLRSCIPENYLFDYVIIDEASQVDLLTGVLAMSCCKQVIIVGDTKQLPQIVDEKIQDKLKIVNHDESYNYFKQSLLSSMRTIYGEDIPNVMLKEHYRCHPKIIGFCNQQYYGNDLIPFTSESEEGVPIRLHYTAIGNHMRRVTIKGKEGSFNHREIDVVKEEILKELQLQNISKEDIGFTTPYRLQVEEASSMLEEGIEIDTVHKYQGREKPVMILSTVLDETRNGQIGKKFVENPNLVNVAVSRAQKQFILVTDHKLFRKSRKDIGNLIRYMEYNTFHEHITQSELVSVFDLLYSEYSEKLNDLQNRLLTKSKYKSENIIWSVLSEITNEEKYRSVVFSAQVYLKDIFRDLTQLQETEKEYIKNRASFDFMIYDAINKQPLLAIEVDGFASHRNNPDQMIRDLLKNNICNRFDFPLLRLPTTGSNEYLKIRDKLDNILYNKEEV